MKIEMRKLIFLTLIVFLSACSKTEFSNLSPTLSGKTDTPVDPVTPTYSSKVSNGLCNQDSSTKVLSCLNCEVPQVKPTPQLSVKAQALVDAMFLACQIPNKSDRNNFRPTKEMLINKMNRGSQLLYPETARTSQMTLVIEGLTNTADSSLRQRMFGGLWYRPPFSDAFETYFGLTVQEAKSTFCWDGDVQTPKITGVSGLYSKKWLDCQYGSNPTNCQELPEYVLALNYRNQIQDVLTKSIDQPYLPPTPNPSKTCSWDKFEGNDVVAAKIQLKKWRAEGRQKLKVEIVKADGAGLCGDADDSAFVVGSKIVIASYVCQ